MSYNSICCFRNSVSAGYRVLLEITNKCNQRCYYCNSRGTHETSLQDITAILKNISNIKIVDMIITGGEPLIHKDIWLILDLIKRTGYTADICSNGSVIDATCAQRLSEYIDEISISLDVSTHCAYKKLRGTDHFERVINGIRLLRMNKIEVHLNAVMNKDTFSDIENLVGLACSLGVPSISLINMLVSHARKTLSVKSLSRHDVKQLTETVSSLRIKHPELKINMKRFGSDTTEACLAGKRILGITSEGMVVPCLQLRNAKYVRCLDGRTKEINQSELDYAFNEFIWDCNAVDCNH